MEIKYHKDIDVLAIDLRDKHPLPNGVESKSDTIRIDNRVIVSVGHDGHVEGLEIIGASEFIDDVEHLTTSGLFVKAEALKI